MTEEEKKAIDILINEIADIVVGEYCTHCKICENEDTECYYTKAIDMVYNLLVKQQKEIEEKHKNWKELLHEYGIKCQELEVLREENFDTVYIQAIADYKSKIREILQIEGNADIETYLKTIVAENNRLEDIEDDRDCNYVSKDKIREIVNNGDDEWYEDEYIIAVRKIRELLEE